MNIIENPSPEFQRQFVLAINERRKLKGVNIFFYKINSNKNIFKFQNKPKFTLTSTQVVSSNEDNNTKVILTVKSLQQLLLSCIDKDPRAFSAG